MKENAIILAGGVLAHSSAKTAHGLIRTTSRFNIIGVIDQNSAGRDAGEVVDGTNRGIRVYSNLNEFLIKSDDKAVYAIIGVAFPGGKLPKEMMDEVKLVITQGISIISGLHDFLANMPALKDLADYYNVKLIDIRKPRSKDELKFWSGEILRVKCPVIGVMGTDCALGKRTTAVMINEAMKNRGLNSHMVFTGQTGWMQGHKYGFILDATYNDFISGELEHAIVSCYREQSPDVIFVEGQSSLCNPSGPCGSEYLLSAQCKAVILQHSPTRVHFNGQEATGIKISLEKELALIRLYDSKVIAITLNANGLSLLEARSYRDEYEKKYNIPVVLPLEDGMNKLAEAVENYSAEFNKVSITI